MDRAQETRTENVIKSFWTSPYCHQLQETTAGLSAAPAAITFHSHRRLQRGDDTLTFTLADKDIASHTRREAGTPPTFPVEMGFPAGGLSSGEGGSDLASRNNALSVRPLTVKSLSDFRGPRGRIRSDFINQFSPIYSPSNNHFAAFFPNEVTFPHEACSPSEKWISKDCFRSDEVCSDFRESYGVPSGTCKENGSVFPDENLSASPESTCVDPRQTTPATNAQCQMAPLSPLFWQREGAARHHGNNQTDILHTKLIQHALQRKLLELQLFHLQQEFAHKHPSSSVSYKCRTTQSPRRSRKQLSTSDRNSRSPQAGKPKSRGRPGKIRTKTQRMRPAVPAKTTDPDSNRRPEKHLRVLGSNLPEKNVHVMDSCCPEKEVQIRGISCPNKNLQMKGIKGCPEKDVQIRGIDCPGRHLRIPCLSAPERADKSLEDGSQPSSFPASGQAGSQQHVRDFEVAGRRNIRDLPVLNGTALKTDGQRTKRKLSEDADCRRVSYVRQEKQEEGRY